MYTIGHMYWTNAKINRMDSNLTTFELIKPLTIDFISALSKSMGSISNMISFERYKPIFLFTLSVIAG